MSSTKTLLDSILSDVKQHSILSEDDDNNLLERRQLGKSILQRFTEWSSSTSSLTQEDIETVGGACLQIVQLRLSSKKQSEHADDSFFSNDSTLRLVLDCAEEFLTSPSSASSIVTARTNTSTSKSDSSSSSNTADDASSSSPSSITNNATSSWQQLLIFICTLERPLEISLRGFQILAKWVLLLLMSKNDKNTASSSLSPSLVITTRKCINLLNDDDRDTALVASAPISSIRLASTLHEKFSTSSGRRFCLATGFDKMIQQDILLPNYFENNNNNNKTYRTSEDDGNNNNNNNNNSNKNTKDVMMMKNNGKRDYLSLATVFTSIAHVIKCCGPNHLDENVAKVFAKYIKSSFSSDDEDANNSSIDEILENQVLRPFVHQAVAEMFQRGTSSDEEIQNKERLSQLQKEKRENNNNNRKSEDAADNNSASDEELLTTQLSEVSPWNITAENVLTLTSASSSSISIIISALLESIHHLKKLSSDDIETWIRSISAVLSSGPGILSLMMQNQRNSNNNDDQQKFAKTFSSIVRQMLHSASSTGTVTVKVIALNAIQSVAVPLGNDLGSFVRSSNNKTFQKEDQERIIDMISLSGDILNHILHRSGGDSSSSNNESIFASRIFPLHRSMNSSSNIGASDDKVSEAFWSMIEQFVVSPPFVEMQKLLLSQNNDEAAHGSNKQNNMITSVFMAKFVEPVLSPMMPSLVSLLSTTSQKELGRELYQRRRGLAMSLLRLEQLCSTYLQQQQSKNNNNVAVVGLICGCSKIMWTKLKNSVLVIGGGGGEQ